MAAHDRDPTAPGPASRLSGWVRGLATPEPAANVRGLAAVYLATGGLWLCIGVSGAAPGLDAGSGAVRGGIAIGVGAVCLILASRFRTWMLHVALCVGIGAVSLVLAQASSAVAAVLVVCSLFWISVFVGIVSEPRVGRLYAVWLSICLGGGMQASAVADPVVIWIGVGATFFVTIEVLSRTISRLRAEALTDPLTGLLNRNGFLDASRRAISMCRRSGEPLTVVHIDLDGFKQVNDSEGHTQGDRLLRLCAEAWRREIRASDILARLGGDEFVLVLPGRDRAAADAVLRRLRGRSPIGWSSGTAELEPGDEDIEACVARADAEMYVTKAEATPPPEKHRRVRLWPQPTMRTGVPRGSLRAIHLM